MRLGPAAALALLCTAGCTKGGQGPSEEDRLIAKLQAEKERQARAQEQGVLPPAQNPLMPSPEPDPLAKTAAEDPAPEKQLKLPDKIDFVAGDLAFRLQGLETSLTVSGGKVKLSTNELFLRVDLKVKALGAAELDLTGATLKAGEEVFPIARDVQAVLGTRNLVRPVEAQESFETVLMFELPEAALAKGPTLRLPAPRGQVVEVPLQ